MDDIWKGRDRFDHLWVAFNVKCRLFELIANLIHRLEGIVLKDFLADLVPDIFLRIQFW